ncbi:MAG: class I SAM-dependent RNA methyltransferase [Deltaproteobacteria bacterium]|nr:MAG: class I SAM-dependent RNA methyltransferase [Deltaproteobacteria bacterium]
MPEVDLAWLNANGSCGARMGKGIVEVRGGVPGDRVAIDITRKRGRNASAVVTEVVTPSADRRAPPCPFDAACGGCDLAALTPDAQLAAKARMVQHALRLPETPSITASPRPTGHRARVKLGLDGTSLGYRRARSHELVDIDVCRIARPEVQAAMTRLRAHLVEHGPLPFTEVEIRSDGSRTVYAFEGSRRDAPDTLHQLGDVAVGGKTISGDATLQLDILGLSLRASPPSFFQVNLEGNALLADFVRQTVLATGPSHVLDLYAGIGNLDLPLAAEGIAITAVELEGAAIRDLAHTAEQLGIADRVSVTTGPAERYDPGAAFFDVLVLDPPRAGAPGVLAKAAVLRPHTVVYVACHVGSLARDAKELLSAGYRMEQVRCYDLFPDTHHVETVAVFRR